jgi:hypothetical protein
MRRVAVALLVYIAIVGARGAAAQSATPTSSTGTNATLVLDEHSDHATDVDLGAAGPSAGDIRVWGPNPLYDADNVSDTGAQTQGTCIALNPEWACVLTETIIFPDGSTLEFQGVERGDDALSLQTIVGGSGQYLGATGTAMVEPTPDQMIWKRTISVTVANR